MNYQFILASLFTNLLVATTIPNEVLAALQQAENIAIQAKPQFAKLVVKKPDDGCKGATDFFIESMTATLYSESDYKGYSRTVAVNGAYGCFNELPAWNIRSFLSTGSTSITFHKGENCLGPVITTVQGGQQDYPTTNDQPGSIFIKYNRFGSC